MRINIRLLSAIGMALFIAGMVCDVGHTAAAEPEQTVHLLKPQTDTEPFLKLVAKRQSTRTYSTQPLPPQTLSNLLWAAFGISRADSGKRTAPTANNKQEIDVYAVMEKGVYLYDAKANQLKLVTAGDHRAAAGMQAYVKDVPLNLIYVADMKKSGGKTDEIKLLYAAAATGFISENVYLYCASAGLATVVRAYVDKAVLAPIMKLRPGQMIILAQTVGYAK
jgi:SagB-type dehydrogenase family enzyme